MQGRFCGRQISDHYGIRGGGELASFLGYDPDAPTALPVPVLLALKISYSMIRETWQGSHIKQKSMISIIL